MGEQDSDQAKEPDDQDSAGSSDETPTEKPEPDEEDKKKAAEMMTAYEERPTLVLPGTGGAVSGTAVGNWLDEDGNPKFANDEDAPAAKGNAAGDGDEETDKKEIEEQAEKDKAFNEEIIKAAREEQGAEDEDDKAVSK
jgi:hypothetical protein